MLCPSPPGCNSDRGGSNLESTRAPPLERGCLLVCLSLPGGCLVTTHVKLGSYGANQSLADTPALRTISRQTPGLSCQALERSTSTCIGGSIGLLLTFSLHLLQARATYRASFLLLDRPKRPPAAALNSSKNVLGTIEVDSVHPRPRTNPPPRRQGSENTRHPPRSKSSSVGRSPKHSCAEAVSPQHNLAPILSMPTVASVPTATLSSATPSGLSPSVSASYYAQGLGVLNSRASNTVHRTSPSLPPPRHRPPTAAPKFL